MKITKEKLKQFIKEEISKFSDSMDENIDLTEEKFMPYTSGNMRKFMRSLNDDSYEVVITLNGQKMEVYETWTSDEDREAHIVIRPATLEEN